jgi:hypothetical protein
VKRFVACALAIGCAAAVADKPAEPPPSHERRPPPRARAPQRMPEVELFFRGEQPFARRGAEEWPLGDVQKSEMIFSPDGRRFAYLREKPGKPMRVLIRNLAGDPINEFAVYRPGRPEELSWIDNRHLGYLAPPDAAKKSGALFVLHDADTGEVLAARPGLEFVWSAQHRHVAFVSGAGARQTVVVDGRNVWPRAGATRIHGEPVWSADGHGVAFTEDGPHGPRLVVLVEFDDPGGDLTWPIPRDALGGGLKVFWAGDSKVVIGDSPLRPRFAADWKRLQ